MRRFPCRLKVSRVLDLAKQSLERTVVANRRADGLYYAYYLMQVDPDGGISIRQLAEMLEGQVAVLSSGCLDARESIDLLESLRASSLYRPDQHRYLLYPDRILTGFMEKNVLPERFVDESLLLKKMLEMKDKRLVSRDAAGQVRFHPEFRNSADLCAAMDGVEECDSLERDRLLAAYEAVFDHQSFTGRSGTFFKYEGLGCIYWHMVSKLLLAVQEILIEARSQNETPEVVARLLERYGEIQAGVGAKKSVIEQGAFPTDPYSHTPSMLGAQQPGLTGQVKEDFIVRLRELGVRIEEGCLKFDPFLLADTEFLEESAEFAGMTLAAGSFGFTFCKVPIVIGRANRMAICVRYHDGNNVRSDELCLDAATSRDIFCRRGVVELIEVSILC